MQDKFLEKSVEIHLEQAQVAPGSDRGTIMIAELAFGEIVFRRDGEARLVQRVQPGVRVFGRNPQGAVGERFGAAVELLQVGRDGFRGGLKEPPQFRLDVKLPFRAHFALGGRRGRTEQALLRRFRSFGVGAFRDLPQKLGQKRIELGNLEAIFLAANLHISLFVRAWPAAGSRGVAGRKARPAPAFRSTRIDRPC